ncbi:condensation domain-containing protein [Micromonospora sp. NPDC049048]|uniref:condensation domain-containing protein n=1 Tax=Micromonospora sp. NPDC049048 TaxID=3364263 RepID=UPI0037114C2C
MSESNVSLEVLVRRARLRTAQRDEAAEVVRPATEVELTPVQQGLWLNGKLRDTVQGQLITWGARLVGPLDARALAAALRELTVRHPRLRSRLRSASTVPTLRVVDDEGDIRVVELADAPADDESPAERLAAMDAAADRVLAKRCTIVDPETGPMFVGTVITAGPDLGYIGIAVHHLVFDGRSLGVFLAELAERYRLRRGHGAADPAGLPPVEVLPLSASGPAVSAGDLDYWRADLAAAPAPLQPRQPGDAEAPPRHDFVLTQAVSQRIRDCAARHRATPFMVLMAALAVTVRREGGPRDVVLGALLDIRGPHEQQQVSYHLNTVPLRIRWRDDAGTTFADLLERARTSSVEAMARRHTPLSTIVSAVRDGGTRADALTQITLDYLQQDDRTLTLDGLHCTVREQFGSSPEFGLGVMVLDAGDRFEVCLEPGPHFLGPDGVRRFAESLDAVLDAATLSPDAPLESVSARRDDALFVTAASPAAAPTAGGAADGDSERSAELTEIVRAAYARTLRLPELPGRDVDFFDLGGQSLLAIRTALEIGRKSGMKVTIRDIFTTPTPAALGRHLAGREAAATDSTGQNR